MLDRGGGADPFVNTEFKAKAVNFTAGDKLISRVSMESVQSPYPYRLMLPQSETERLLEERLGSLGVERQTELTKIQCSLDGFDAVLRHADGREESVSADWLIGCDGAHSARAAWPERSIRRRNAGERLDASGHSHDRLSLARQRGLDLLARNASLLFFRSPPGAIVFCRTCRVRESSNRRHSAWSRFKCRTLGSREDKPSSCKAGSSLTGGYSSLSPSSLLGQYLFKVNAA